MPDPYAVIADLDESIQESLADICELRAGEPRQREMLDEYLFDLPLETGSRVLEVGCGTGAVTRVLAQRPTVAEVVGLDPSPVLLGRAGRLGQGIAGLSFVLGDGRVLEFPDESFDAVVCHTSLCHIPEPQRALAEAWRVTRPGGWLAVFDNDPTIATVAIGDHDPLQACIQAAIDAFVNDPWVIHRVPTMASAIGYGVVATRSHGYVETAASHYMLSVVDRGADALVTSGVLQGPTGDALKLEARSRVEAGSFYAHAGYASVIARRS